MSVTEPMKEALSKLFPRDCEFIFAISSTISQSWSLCCPFNSGEVTIEVDDDSKEIGVKIDKPVKKSHIFSSNAVVILEMKKNVLFFCDGEMCGIATTEIPNITQL